MYEWEYGLCAVTAAPQLRSAKLFDMDCSWKVKKGIMKYVDMFKPKYQNFVSNYASCMKKHAGDQTAHLTLLTVEILRRGLENGTIFNQSVLRKKVPTRHVTSILTSPTRIDLPTHFDCTLAELFLWPTAL